MAPLRDLPAGGTRETYNDREYARGYNSAVNFASMGVEIKSSPGNCQYCSSIHDHLFPQLNPKDVNKPEIRKMEQCNIQSVTSKIC
jgi:hypothetical protein